MVNKNSLDNLFEEMIITEIAESIIYDSEYKNNLLNKSNLYFNTIDVVKSALTIYEKDENYETCALLLNFKKELVNKAKEKLDLI